MKPEQSEYEWTMSTGALLAYSLVLAIIVAAGIVAAVQWL